MSNTAKLTFITSDGHEQEVDAPIGLSILEIAHQNDVDLEGACEGSLACATCHIILEEKFYNKLEQPEEAEEDMLDLAFGLSHTSRLGCQVIMTEELNGMKVKLPSATRNIKL